MPRFALVVVIVPASLASAHADDKTNVAAMRKLLDTSLTGPLDDADPPTAKDPLLVFPGEFGKGSWSSWRMNAPYVSSVKIVNSTATWIGGWGWIAADLSVRQRPYSDSSGAPRQANAETHRYHLLQVYVLDGKDVKLKATMLTDTRPDSKLVAGKSNPAKPMGDQSSMWKLVNPGKLLLAPDAQLAMLGSSEGEVGFGAVAAKKLLASWSKLELKNVGPYHMIVDKDFSLVISEIDLVVKGKPVRLRGMLVSRYVDGDFKVVAISYGADSEFGDPKRP